jgi:hypothetical protein
MASIEQSLEAQLAQEARQRELLQMYEDGEYGDLLAAAELLNVALGQQQAISQWLAKEAADNLGEAWQASRNSYGRNHGQTC